MNVTRNDAVNIGLSLLLFHTELFFKSFSMPRVRGISKPQRDATFICETALESLLVEGDLHGWKRQLIR
jgi:hypothetical protein